MPQLDKVTFLSQFFWLVFFFFGFYLFQLKHFLPEMSRLLKFRKKTLNQSLAFTLQEENSKVENSVSTVLENLFKNGNNVFKSSSSTSDNWFSDFAVKLNQNKFKKCNNKYFQSIAEKSLSNNLAMVAVAVDNSLEKDVQSTAVTKHDSTTIAAGHQNFLNQVQAGLSTKSLQFACGTALYNKLFKHLLLSISKKSFSSSSTQTLAPLAKKTLKSFNKDKTGNAKKLIKDRTLASESGSVNSSELKKLDKKDTASIDKQKKNTTSIDKQQKSTKKKKN